MLSASKSGSGLSTGYNLTRSLRTRASAGGYLNRTNTGTVTNNAVWTYSAWVKLGYWSSGNAATLLGTGAGGSANESSIKYVNNQINVINYVGSSVKCRYITTAVYRDPSAWYHVVVSSNSSTSLRIYINNVQITAFDTAVAPDSSAWGINTASTASYMGWLSGNAYFDGYLTEVNFIDGQALTPSSFGSTNTLTGVWQPARYAGTYGTNGFYLPFTDNSALTTSSNVGLGKDFSGNGNYWTTNNISITTGVTYDSMTDVPTLTSATAANFAVLNPVDKASGATTSNANLRVTTGAAYDEIRATLAVNTKNYFEVTNSGTPSGSYAFLAGFQITQLSLTSVSAARANEFRIISRTTTDVQSGTTTLFSPTAVGNGEVIQFAIDVAAGKAWIGRASAWYDSAGGTTGNPATGANPTFTFTATEVYAVVGGYNVDASFNAGQRPFTYTPPTGFVALNTYNLPTSTILAGNKVMDATLYSGNSSTQNIVNAAGFKPDLVWPKARSVAYNNTLYDSVRGATKTLFPNLTNAEVTEANTLTAFNSNGFSLGSEVRTNESGNTYVAWQWQAGQGSTSSNTSGSITSTVSVNASAGFSIVTYTGNGTNGATVGHGLGVKPSLIIEKGRASTYNWVVQGCGVLWPTATQTLFLNSTSALNAGSAIAAPTSSVFTPAALSYANESGLGYVAYCWTPIAGYSAFGSLTGNGSADGPMVYTGFQPKFVLMKRTDTAGYDWWIWDSVRNNYNQANLTLLPDSSIAEVNNSSISIDTLSNGFKIRGSNANINASGGSYIYAAFATSPFKNSLAF